MEEISFQIGRDFGMIWCRRRLEETLEMVSHLEPMRKNIFLYLEKVRIPKERRPKVMHNPKRTI